MRNILCNLKLIIQDIVIMLIRCLIVTILCSICIENGWIFTNHIINVSYNMFWRIYSLVFILIPIIIFYKVFTGKYNIVLQKHIITPFLGKAKLVNDIMNI